MSYQDQPPTSPLDVISFSPNYVCICDAEYNILEASQSFADFTGYEKEEIVGMSLANFDLRFEARKRSLDDVKSRSLGTEKFTYPSVCRDKEGKVSEVEIQATAFALDGATRIYVSFSPYSSLAASTAIAAESSLSTTDQRFRVATESGGIGVWDWNLVTNDVYFSPEWKSMLGYEDHELPNVLDTWSNAVHPEDLDGVMEEVTNYIKGLTPKYESKHRVKCKDGSYLWILDAGRIIERNDEGMPTRMIGTHTNITNHIEVQELKRVNQILEATQRIAKIGSWEYHLPTNKFICDEYVHQYWGVPKDEELSAERQLAAIVPEDRHILIKSLDDVIVPNGVREHKLRVITDFGIRYLYESWDVENDETGAPFRAIGFTQDITDKVAMKHKEEELALKVDHQRVEQQNQMLQMLAHQWRQPLQDISLKGMWLKIFLEKHNIGTDEAQRMIDSALQTMQHLSATIDDFRNFFKQEHAYAEVDVTKALDMTLKMLAFKINKGGIEVDFPCRDTQSESCQVTIQSRASELNQVFHALINNAIEAFELAKVEEKVLRIHVERQGDHVLLNIADTAGGIPEHVINRVFDAYFSTKKQLNGTGLGLYMSKLIVEKHCHGSIQVANKDGGAHFTISLPITAAQ